MAVTLNRSQLRNRVRDFLGDLIERNELYDGFEISESVVDLCIDLALDTYSTVPPFIHTFTDVTGFPSLQILLYATVAHCIYSGGIFHMRNFLSVSDGGITIATHETKVGLYKRWADDFYKETLRRIMEYKKSLNAENTYGGVSSEYSVVSYQGGYLGLMSAGGYAAARGGFISTGI